MWLLAFRDVSPALRNRKYSKFHLQDKKMKKTVAVSFLGNATPQKGGSDDNCAVFRHTTNIPNTTKSKDQMPGSNMYC